MWRGAERYPSAIRHELSKCANTSHENALRSEIVTKHKRAPGDISASYANLRVLATGLLLSPQIANTQDVSAYNELS